MEHTQLKKVGFGSTSLAIVLSVVVGLAIYAFGQPSSKVPDTYLFNDSHFHLTNYIQKGTDIHKYLEIMGDKVGRSTLFGIPLQQTWSYANSGDFAPTYYLQSDASLYYYSFTDAFIASTYLKLKPEERQRLDPMITGFNPADMVSHDGVVYEKDLGPNSIDIAKSIERFDPDKSWKPVLEN